MIDPILKTASRDVSKEEHHEAKKRKKKSGEEKITLCIEWAFGALLFFVPFFFLPITDDIFDLNKQTLLFAGTLIISILYCLRIVTTHAITIRGSFLSLTLLLTLGAWFVASILSPYPYASLVGLEGQASMSFATLACLLVLVFIGTNVFTAMHVVRLLRVLVLATTLLSITGLLQLFGLTLFPGNILQTNALYPAGLITSLGLNAALGLMLAVVEILRIATKGGKKSLSFLQFLFACVAGLQLIVLTIFDEWQLWMAVGTSIGLILCFLYVKLPKDQKMSWLVLPSFVFVFSLTMILINVPRFISPIQAPQLSLRASVDIAIKSLQERPLFGYGPGNFIIAYTKFKPKEININEGNFDRLWMERFGQSGSHLLSSIIGIGLVGSVALLILFLTLAFKTLRSLIKYGVDEDYVLFLGVSASLMTLGTLGIVKPLDLTLTIFFWMLVGFFSILSARSFIHLKGQNSSRFIILSSLILFAVISMALVGTIFAGIRYAADATFAQANTMDRSLSSKIQAGEQMDESQLNELLTFFERATRMNPLNHRYPKALSQALVFKTSTLAAQTQNGQQNLLSIQSLSQNAITVAQQAVQLSSSDARNTQNLAEVLQGVFPFVENGYAMTQEAYTRALQQDPSNPALQVSFAKFYLSAYALVAKQEANLKKEEEKTQIQEQKKLVLDEAEKLLRESLELKGDYAESYFHLGTVYAVRKDNDQALKHFDAALEINFRMIPFRASDEVLFYNLGLNYETLKQRDKALTAYKLASSLRPNYYLALWKSALLDQEAGNTATAVQALNQILKFDPENKIVQDKIKELENGKQNKEEKENQ